MLEGKPVTPLLLLQGHGLVYVQRGVHEGAQTLFCQAASQLAHSDA